MPLRFGTAGVPRSAKGESSEDGIRRIRELGLDHMEMEWVQRVPLNPEKGAKLKALAEELGVTLSAHGPYYINLNAQEPDKVEASFKRILDALRMGQHCGAKSMVFHAAFFMKMDPEIVYPVVRDRLKTIVEQAKAEKLTLDIRTELSGKPSAFGSLDEIIRVSREVPGIKPTVDFSHQHARTAGKFNTYEEFTSMLDAMKKGLGAGALKDMHMHVSGIKYTDKGEREHQILKESDYNYKDLMRALAEYGAEGYLVCESPNLEEDALLLQETFRKEQGRKKK